MYKRQALILKQPDLSTSIVIVFFILCLIYMAGISYKWIAGALAVAVPSLALVVWLAEHLSLIHILWTWALPR